MGMMNVNDCALSKSRYCEENCAVDLAVHGKGIQGLVRDFWRWQALVWVVKRERRELRELPQNLLQDIGIDRVTAEKESSRKSWDLPDTRR